MNRLSSLAKSGPAAIAAGLGLLGVSSYTFLLIAGQVLGDEKYAPFGTLWILIFLLAPAFFFPVEQEIGRAVASRKAQNLGALPVFRKAAILAVAMAVGLIVLTVALSPLFYKQLFNDQWLMLVALLVAYVTFGAEYLLKGVLAGSGRLGAYGFLIAVEGAVRATAGILFAVGGFKSASPYALLVGLACLAAVVVVTPGKQTLLQSGPDANWRELSASLGNLVTASLLSQVLINGAPIVVKYMASASQQVLAGAFVKAIVVTRIPVFLFQAVQAVLLPRLTHFSTRGEHAAFRRTLYTALGLVAVIGAAGTIGAAILGDELLRLFGSDYDLSRGDMAMLAAGNALFLLCMTVAQSLVAVRGQGWTVIGWGSGVIGFAIAFATPGAIVTRAEVALIAGAAVSLLVLSFALASRVRHLDDDGDALVEAFAPQHGMTEL